MVELKSGCGCGCGTSCGPQEAEKEPVQTGADITINDMLGTAMVRLGFNRNNYRVSPGLYMTGKPGRDSEVFVSANYKLSFDTLRRNLKGMDAWILVLDTRGINVWCAAGKGTFGTTELVSRITEMKLASRVAHRRVIVPQLGAPGVSAHEVAKATGFRVVYGPVRAEDIKAFMDAGMKATDEMRRVRFDLRDRAVLVPVELTAVLFYTVAASAILFAAHFAASGFSLAAAFRPGLVSGAGVLAAVMTGLVLTPLLLPWLPGRSFSIKGLVTGAIAAGLFVYLSGKTGLQAAAWAMLIPGISSFLAMGFTGASTYTSLSGTVKEMGFAMPMQAFLSLAGIVLMTVSLITGGAL